MNSSAEINELALALSKAQSQMDYATKGSKNPFFKSNYASLADCWAVAREPLALNELALIQTCVPSDKNEVVVETILAHSSGQWIGSVLAVPVLKNEAQSFGSALTYNRRYSMCAILGISPEDDDGNMATAAAPKKTFTKGRETITSEAAKMINQCNDAEQLELAYKEILLTVTTQSEKNDLINCCKLKKEIIANAQFIADLDSKIEDMEA